MYIKKDIYATPIQVVGFKIERASYGSLKFTNHEMINQKIKKTKLNGQETYILEI